MLETLLIFALVVILALYLAQYLPPDINRIAQAIIVVIAIIYLIRLML